MRRLLLPTKDLWLIRPTRQRMWSPIKKRLLRPDTLQLLRLAKLKIRLRVKLRPQPNRAHVSSLRLRQKVNLRFYTNMFMPRASRSLPD